VRRRLVISTIAIVMVVLAALAIPVGLIVYNVAERQLITQLERKVADLAGVVDTDLRAGREPDLRSISDLLVDGEYVRLYDRTGDLADWTPTSPPPLSGLAQARTLEDGSRLVLDTDEEPLDDVFRNQLNVLLMLALGGIIAAAGLAAVQGHQLARPLERLAARAGRIGDGDFSVQPFARTHIPEIDHIGTALDVSSQRVDTMLANERHFTADATHQLRTGIAGIAMRLEILTMHPDALVADEASAALSQTDQLNTTIDELLAAARNRSVSERSVFDLTNLVNSHAAEWQPRFTAVRRHVSVITSNPAPPVFGTKGLAGQVIDILIHNALKHGAGAVTLMIDGPSVIVIDQGAGVPRHRLRTLFDGPVDPAARHGRGLPLARRLAEVDGGSLDVVGNHPLRLRFQLVRGDHALAG
jgi:signal transduction histidine kinase